MHALIDHFYVTSEQYITKVCVPDYGTSDRYPICLTWYNKRCNIPKIGHKEINYRCFRNLSFDLQHSRLEYVYQIRNPDEAGGILDPNLYFCVQKACAIPKEKSKECNKTSMDNLRTWWRNML